MTKSEKHPGQQHSEIAAALDRNRKRRNRAQYETDEAREELAELLARGLSLPRPFKIAEMARTADISRETAHKLLRRRSDG